MVTRIIDVTPLVLRCGEMASVELTLNVVVYTDKVQSLRYIIIYLNECNSS